MNPSHRDLCISAARWLLGQNAIQLVSWELGLDVGTVDVIGLTLKTRKHKIPKVAVIEVKRSRADLLQDLKKRKMHGYEARASHCYLAVTKDAVWTPGQLKAGEDRQAQAAQKILDFLSEKGLPKHWGILLYSPNGGDTEWRCLRAARSTGTQITKATLAAITKKIALSFMYRVLNPNSPMTEQH